MYLSVGCRISYFRVCGFWVTFWVYVPIWTVLRDASPYAWSVRMTDLTPQLLLAVPCPTCGVDAGKDCLSHSGGLSSEPHIDRTLDAAKAIETNNAQPTPE